MANKNVVGLFDSSADARGALEELKDSGFGGDDISFVASNSRGEYTTTTGDNTDTQASEGAGFGATGGAVLGGLAGLLVGLGSLAIPGIGPVVAAGSLATTLGSTAVGAGLGAAAGGLVGALVGAGIPEEHANVYAEGVRRGGALISVSAAADEQVGRAVDIMDQHNVVDIEQRGAEYRSQGFTRFDETAAPYAASDTLGATDDAGTTGSRASSSPARFATGSATGLHASDADVEAGGEARIPVVEEELRVGKREVETGGVRVTTRVEETPVNENVTLREERVEVHRRPVDRPVSEADLASFQEGTFDVRERAEEAVVDKRARVVEEVHVQKTAAEHTEQIQGSVRRTDVDVQELGGASRTSASTTPGNIGGEGPIESALGDVNNAVERNAGIDTDRSGAVGDRDRRDNY